MQCQHPTINPETNAGLVRGVLRYAEALDECSIQNSGSPGAIHAPQHEPQHEDSA